MIKKTDNGWLVDIQPGGRGCKRYRKSFPSKAEAQRWQTWLLGNKQERNEWEPKPSDIRTLKELASLWFSLYGKQLKDGEARKRKLDLIADRLGNPRATSFTAQTFGTYRKERLESGTSPNTVNHEHAYIRAMFNELSRLGEWGQENPLANIRKLKVDETELAYLTLEQIRDLLEETKKGSNPDTYYVTSICLATGARWSEAESLRREHVRNGRITFIGTKSGKNRTVPITQDLEQLIISNYGKGKLFGSCHASFRHAVQRAGIELPPGQMAHVLRHTFASHFMMNGGNILVLQRVLGHASLTMTMRYAHFSPDHLEEARKYNPLSCVDSSLT